jgi:hypothetical protein
MALKRDNSDSAEVSTPKKQENVLACSNHTSRKSGLSSLKVERVNPLHFAQSVFVNFR